MAIPEQVRLHYEQVMRAAANEDLAVLESEWEDGGPVYLLCAMSRTADGGEEYIQPVPFGLMFSDEDGMLDKIRDPSEVLERGRTLDIPPDPSKEESE